MGAFWQLTVPETIKVEAVKVKPGAQVAVATVNLLNFDRPSMMTEWLLSYIRIPGVVAVKMTAKPAGLVEADVQLILRLGGDICWSANQNLILLGTGEEEKVKSATFVFAADLVNSIVVPDGRTLTLDAVVSFPAETDITTLAIGASINPAGTTAERNEGKIGYSVRKLTGHRELS